MTKEQCYKLFDEIYVGLEKLGVAKTVVLNFRVPRKEQGYIFAYCLNDQYTDEVKGHCVCLEDDEFCSEISLNPRVLKMETETIRNTLAHELIHTIKGCDDHNDKFLKKGKRARKILDLKDEVGFCGTLEESEILERL